MFRFSSSPPNLLSADLNYLIILFPIYSVFTLILQKQSNEFINAFYWIYHQHRRIVT